MNAPNRLPTVRIDDAEYFVDRTLQELRSVDNPHKRIELTTFYCELSRGDIIHMNGNDYQTAGFHLRATQTP